MGLRLRPGGWGWVGVVAYVAVIDGLLIARKRETLSEVFGAALLHPWKRLPVLAVWAVLTAHLFAELMPEWLRVRFKKVDPISGLAKLVEFGVY